jgi:hypothetical protein
MTKQPLKLRRKAWTATQKPSQLLLDMRYVYNTEDPANDDTQGKKLCRELLKKDGGGFMQKLQAFEREYAIRRAAIKAKQAGQAGGEEGDTPVVKDEGTLKVTGLIDEVLEAMERERNER